MSTETAIFHEGELAIQNRLGVAERMDKFGRKVIRDHMPEQHQQFYQQLPMVFAGFTDGDDNVWASVLASKPGFIGIDNPKALSLKAKPFAGDPLNNAISSHTGDTPLLLGLLGIELATRRRNRLSAQVKAVSANEVSLDVLQTFGNCPQYIQSRTLHYVEGVQQDEDTREFRAFDSALTQFIQHADTFFVASSTKRQNANSGDVTQGADVSHRGGRSGFVRVDDSHTLTIPDYMGNNHFNTLGNFVVNPSAGLLFIDFDSGDIITMTGKATILWDDDSQTHFKGAERLWQFKLEKGFVLKNVMPYRFNLENWSPNSMMTGTWSEADALANQKALENQWLSWTIDKTQNESSAIKSFYFRTHSGSTPRFKPGQFLTISVAIDGKKHVRNYSVSSSPFDDFIRISVKRDGLVSNWLHDNVSPGQTIDVKLPNGGFHIDMESDKPVVMLSAGVGITPMVSTMRYVLQNSLRTRKTRQAIMVNTFRKAEDQAFFTEINQLLRDTNQDSNAYWLLTSPDENTKPGVDYSGKGRISKEVLQAILPLGKYQFYLCGPGPFMQDTYDLLLELGVQDEDIMAEAFGPASIKRIAKKQLATDSAEQAEVAETAVIQFAKSQVEQPWQKVDGNLLDFAESHGLEPEFGCRGGSCGSCKVKVTKGEVIHSENATFPVAEGEALLCCAMPKKTGVGDIETVIVEA